MLILTRFTIFLVFFSSLSFASDEFSLNKTYKKIQDEFKYLESRAQKVSLSYLPSVKSLGGEDEISTKASAPVRSLTKSNQEEKKETKEEDSFFTEEEDDLFKVIQGK